MFSWDIKYICENFRKLSASAEVNASINTKSKTGGSEADDIAGKIYLLEYSERYVYYFQSFVQKESDDNYPEQKRSFPRCSGDLHILNRDEEGRERCTACGLCAVACPAEAITMEAAERQPGEEHLYREEKYAAKYEINMLRCIFCGFCEEACPKDAIYLSQTFAPANYSTARIYL